MSLKLALLGGKPALTTSLIKTNNIGDDEADAASICIRNGTLSGYIGGVDVGGPYVQALERMWELNFKVKHAIVCNSATSGLLAACIACGVTTGDEVITTPFTMSATAAVPAFLGAMVSFYDVDPDHFCLTGPWPRFDQKAVIATNLFGHPAELAKMRQACDRKGMYLIEDNAQAILAMEHGKYTGTIGHIGVFSLNVHKHIHCGEGGVVVTNDDNFAARVRHTINHGEMAGLDIGLNFRLTEYAAAIAIEQLRKADAIVNRAIAQAEALTAQAKKFEWIMPPKVRDGCKHVYYCWAFQLEKLGISRELFAKAMAKEGFPLNVGYVNPLYRLPAFAHSPHISPMAEHLHDVSLMYFENTMYSLNDKQINQFGEALSKIESDILMLREA